MNIFEVYLAPKVIQSPILQQKLILMQPPEWKGSHPQRFSGGRIHIRPEDELNRHLVSHSQPQPLGLKTFTLGQTPQQNFKPIVRIYPDKYNSAQKQIDPRGKKITFLGQQPERWRKQKGHVEGGKQSNKQIQMKGIKTFDQSNQTRDMEYKLQSKMQAKARVLGLQQQKNNLTVASLGDKSYKYPEYASDFFKEGGLITGATAFKLRPGQNNQLDPNKLKSIFTKPMWTEKVKMEQKQEETKVLDSVDQWEKTILKQGNPNWNDPQTFFQRMEKKAGVGGAGGKDVKKGAKK